jgi:tRNA modification GTPase
MFRISGPNAFGAADKILRQKWSCSTSPAHTVHRAHVVSPESGRDIDDVIVTVFRAPHSYTGDDVVEISCHGGPVPMQGTLQAILSSGARMAEPGEFTFRAFMNGKLDLAQAQSVADMISAKTAQAHKAALDQHSGRLSKSIDDLRESLLFVVALIEASIDFPEDVGELDTDECSRRLNDAKNQIDSLLSTANRGILQREGAKLVLAGRPNAGKSSLMNALLGASRAIVTPVPGTTRDLIEETINIKGIPARIIDTAGIRKTDDLVEKLGVERSEASVDSSDLAIIVLDASQSLNEEDRAVILRVSSKPTLFVLNKIDIAERCQRESFLDEAIKVSALTGEGIEALEEAIAAKLLGDDSAEISGPVITHARQKNALLLAKQRIEEAEKTILSNMPSDFLAIDARGAISAIDEITGSSAGEDIVSEIFSKFCIGK